MVFALCAVLYLPRKQGAAPFDLIGLLIAGLLGAFVVVTSVLMIKRRSIDISADRISIKHSYYTFNLDRSAVTSVSVREIQSINELGLSIKTNGIALFGYYSGWFLGVHNQKLFCAISAMPAFDIAIEGETLKCKRIGISCSPEVADRIRSWAGVHQVE